MNNLGITRDQTMLSVDLPESLTTSPSVSTFLPEEDVSTCPLLPSTPSPPPMDFIHPLTPSTGNDENTTDATLVDDGRGDSSSSGSSSGIGMDVPQSGPSTMFHKHSYQHLGKNGDILHQVILLLTCRATKTRKIHDTHEETHHQENGVKQNGNLQKSKETPNFVSWNWPVIRKYAFYLFMSGIFAMSGIVIAQLITLPSTCNPRQSWYKGSVFYEIFPASFQDSNGDGIGDLRGLASRVEYLKNLGISAVRLNSIFTTPNYPDQFDNITTLMEISPILGDDNDISLLIASLHARNISLILDIPLYPYLSKLPPVHYQLNESHNSSDSEHHESLTFTKQKVENMNNIILRACRKYLSMGVNGFYMKGLENFAKDPYLLDSLKEYKKMLGADRILIIGKELFDVIEDSDMANEIIRTIDLVDVYIDVTNGTQYLSNQIKAALSEPYGPLNGGWIHWNIGGVSQRRPSSGNALANATLAATLMELMLPGTPSIFYGDEISLENVNDPLGDHSDTKHLHHLPVMSWQTISQFTNRDAIPWLPESASASFHHYDYATKLIELRERSPSLYQNFVLRENQILSNTNVRHSRNDLIIVERWYPRRNSFVSITNLGNKVISLDLSALFYSGDVMVGPSISNKIYFSEFEIPPMETIIVKLHK